MNRSRISSTRTALLIAGFFLLSACATAPKPPEVPLDSRVKLTALQSNPELATRAPVEMKEAEAAVKAAETPRTDDEAYAAHLLLLADQKVEIARARAQSRLYEDQRQALSEQSERARLEARTLEADRARMDATAARADAASARDEIAASRATRQDLERQIAELNARETDRGLVVTLGDVLFATGKSNLMGGAGANLDKLAAFLGEYPDRTVLIEGHTDSVGSEASNQLLSQRRADSVKSYLVNRGVQANRISTAGLGEGSPVASNDTATGRQQNRRVEVIISNTTPVPSRN
ncbi:OmpA family protein [Thioalkalivibrio sp. XN279]|uniref:OmpA family protein n=1 Tax=Thioalkalivibrio sp. XN279 TaxID=2714953 RepID=UPI0014097E7D|nr:OmpA family protein [Thioalkalivibrio sp. XN279]NHA14638.1 OmpA family protein [Thioalkalivibrio sp. XN279]